MGKVTAIRYCNLWPLQDLSGHCRARCIVQSSEIDLLIETGIWVLRGIEILDADT